MAKYYAVRQGHIPGVYTSWDECKKQVNGYSGAEYKSFPNEADAKLYVYGEVVAAKPILDIPNISDNGCLAFVDGSYSKSKNLYSYGIEFHVNDKVYHYCKCDNKDYAVEMNNVAGELSGTMRACMLALEFGKTEIVIIHDYEGIAKWVDENNPWKANLQATKEYKDFIAKMRTHLKITFIWTRGHIGVEGNEMADKLAKKAISDELMSEYIFET